MQRRLSLALYLAAALPALAQTAPPPESALPKDPAALLAAAAPYYNFNDPTMKPWHLKATYQLYDDKGNPTEQGTYEYWWASPAVHRSTWTRPGVALSEWATADGKLAALSQGAGLTSYERSLPYALLSPLPSFKQADSVASHLLLREVKFGPEKLPCIFVVPSNSKQGQQAEPDSSLYLALYPAYCFDPHIPALRFKSMMGRDATQYNNLVSFQNRVISKEIVFVDNPRKHLTAAVDSITLIDSSDPAFTPPPEAAAAQPAPTSITAGIAVGLLIHKEDPIRPTDPYSVGKSGVVILQATIGTDGKVHNIHVLSSPWPSFAASAQYAVSRWRYKPYELAGKPVEVQTTIQVVFP